VTAGAALAAPSVSVVIATFNRAAWLNGAIETLLSQSLSRSEFEILVVDDGSEDDTNQVLARYRDDIVTVSVPHAGLVAACNVGLRQVRGKYLVRVDSDDTVERELLTSELTVLEQSPEVVAVTCDRYEHEREETRVVRVDPDNVFDLLATGVMMRTEAVRKVGGYRSTFWEEYDLFIRLRQVGAFARVPLPLYRYVRHGATMTSRDTDRVRGWNELIDRWGVDLLRRFGSHQELDAVSRERDGARAS
jgi:glycosyltransferase involved in cell wall biosynthesis